MPFADTTLSMSPEEFERYALFILKQQLPLENYRFEHNKIIKVSDGNYQIDGYIEFEIMGIIYKTIVECKHYKTSISREKVQILFDKLRALGAQKGILVSSSNFQSGAISYATAHGIALIQMTEAGSEYATRSAYGSNEDVNRVPHNAAIPYIGVMLESQQESTVQCSYLSSSNLTLRDYLTLK